MVLEVVVGESRLVWLEKEQFVAFDGGGHPVVVSSQTPENAVSSVTGLSWAVAGPSASVAREDESMMKHIKKANIA